MFIVGEKYTRQDVAEEIEYPEAKRTGGDINTGYFEHGGAIYIFATVGIPGRTGHDYPNRWFGAELVWYGKSRTARGQPQIERLIGGANDVHIFWRGKDRPQFTYAGLAFAREAIDTTPVQVVWHFETPLNANTEPDREAPTKPPIWRRGPPPSPGERSAHFSDKPTSVYLMKLEGAAKQHHDRLDDGSVLIKIGISVSPKRRLGELNAGFPRGLTFRWKIVSTKKLPNGKTAFAEESRILETLRDGGSWIGGEFAVVDEASLEGLLGAG